MPGGSSYLYEDYLNLLIGPDARFPVGSVMAQVQRYKAQFVSFEKLMPLLLCNPTLTSNPLSSGA